MNCLFTIILLLISIAADAQKKPLDHTVYDGWQSIGERMISNDGKWVVYTVTPQEGDAELFVHSTDGSNFKKSYPRGYNAVITEDNRFVVFKIKPLYKDTREARIKKKKPEDFPKDSFAVVELGKESTLKTAKIRSYKTPKKASGWVAYHKEKDPITAKQAALPTQKTVDSLKKTIDSLVLLVREIKNIKGGNADQTDADEDPAGAGGSADGSDLVLRNLMDGKEKIFPNVAEYYFNAYGQKLLMKISKSSKDSLSKNAVVIYDLNKGIIDTILKGGNDFKGFALTEDGSKAAFVAERDAKAKDLQKFYKLYVYTNKDSAEMLVDKTTEGMLLGTTVSENGTVAFSKTGNRLFFGNASIQPPKDTTLIETDLVKLDIWHYKDDYLQSQQLFNLQNELKRSYLAVYDFTQQKMEQLASKDLPTIIQTNEGDGVNFYAVTDTGRRVQRQWGDAKTDVYAVDVASGKKTLVKRNHEGQFYPSSTGKYILLYDAKAKNYFNWDGKNLKNITSKIKVPLYNEEHDSPGEPGAYGIMGWHEGDSAVYIYDRYDVWKVDPTGTLNPVNITVDGRKTFNEFRYVRLDTTQRFLQHSQLLYFRTQNQKDKKGGFAIGRLSKQINLQWIEKNGPNNFTLAAKSKNGDDLVVAKENYTSPPDIYYYSIGTALKSNSDGSANVKLSSLNPQQSQYNWGTAELFKWKAFNGKWLDGILYTPEDFDSTKKYPMLIYFYERLSDGLYNYQAPSPTPSRINIPFYVSRGYLVFAPDITYTVGHPAKDAYNSVVSGAQALSKKKWVDAKNIAIQGQSWGGIQVAQLITMTNMFKAAWAGAPVANMTSAYGGIRWEGGVNRQFQYEKTQSRIGATLWQRPDLYIENSPLFHVPKIKTPLVIMSNDADGAVPWYQGIELFTAMRRLDKKVWMLNYNGEAHNLVERKNRKDIQVRQQQYFDWLLKGAKPARWITEGLPATQKGKDWALQIVQ